MEKQHGKFHCKVGPPYPYLCTIKYKGFEEIRFHHANLIDLMRCLEDMIQHVEIRERGNAN